MIKLAGAKIGLFRVALPLSSGYNSGELFSFSFYSVTCVSARVTIAFTCFQSIIYFWSQWKLLRHMRELERIWPDPAWEPSSKIGGNHCSSNKQLKLKLVYMEIMWKLLLAVRLRSVFLHSVKDLNVRNSVRRHTDHMVFASASLWVIVCLSTGREVILSLHGTHNCKFDLGNLHILHIYSYSVQWCHHDKTWLKRIKGKRSELQKPCAWK